MTILSPAEDAFVEALIDLGDPAAAAAVAGVQPSLGRAPHIQSALVDRLRGRGALDAVYARKILYDLAKRADNDGTRLRAASLLWERGLGKVPDEINLHVSLEHVDRASLHAEIKQLITELGMPPLIEGDFEEVEEAPLVREEVVPHPELLRPEHKTEPASAPNTGAGSYIPELPQKWR